MKKVLLSMVLMFVSAVAYSQGVIGKWVTEGGDSQVEIYQNGDQLCGKIIGVNILTGLKKKGNKYEGGKIYNPKNGKTYKCSIWLEGNNLKVRGYVAMFNETQNWTKK